MKIRVFLSTIGICFCFFVSYGQSQCDILLDAARKYKKEGSYEKAVENYDRLERKCPNYFTETVKGERNYCKKKMNQPKFPAKQPVLDDQDSSVIVSYDDSLFEARGGFRDIWVNYEDNFFPVINDDWLEVVSQSKDHILVKCLPNNSPGEREGNVDIVFEERSGSGSITITFRQKAGAHTSVSSSRNPQEFAETSNLQSNRVRVSFEAGDAKTSFENVWKLIGGMEENKNLVLQIEVPWCRNQYSMKLIEKRIQNIIDYFIASGIEAERISSSIILVDVEDDYHFFVDYQNSEKDKDPRISNHITLINVEEGYHACDSAWLKTEELIKVDDDFIRPISDALSKTKISFDLGKDSPIIYDDHDNIVKTVAILKNNNKLKLVVEGYACDASNDAESWDLANRRSNNVREIFIQMGVKPDQIETATYTLIDPQTGQRILNSNKEECRAAIFRIEKRLYFEIAFDYDSDIPKIYENNKDVDEFVVALNEDPNLKLIVEGYTGGLGLEEHNRDLAMRRSSRVRDIFIKKGVSPDRIETASYTVNDPQNQNNENQVAFDGAICRIVKR